MLQWLFEQLQFNMDRSLMGFTDQLPGTAVSCAHEPATRGQRWRDSGVPPALAAAAWP
jgi:hypothetical protein